MTPTFENAASSMWLVYRNMSAKKPVLKVEAASEADAIAKAKLTNQIDRSGYAEKEARP